MNLPKLNLPTFEFKIKNDKYIFDEIRKKYVHLTPEEWVRQNIIKYLTQKLGYPHYLLGIEKQIKVFNTIKRPDIIIFDKKLNPLMIAEIKQAEIKINQKTFNQALNYYLELKSKYFLLTNGIRHYCCKIKEKKCFFLDKIPKYTDL
jgi:hypothetical protein